MIELTQHIEMLLLENDFVIVPDFGGFIAHYNQAEKADGECTFCPPTRTIGFNPQLTLNDGLLIQSYMSVHDLDFSGATKMVCEEVKHLKETLHEDGVVKLPNIGELHYTMHHTYDFVPYKERTVTPSLYGLEAFEMKPLAVLRKETHRSHTAADGNNRRSFTIRINRTLARNAVAAVVAIGAFFAMSTPIENTYTTKGSYAQLLPMDVFESIKGQSVLTTAVQKDQTKTDKQQTKAEKQQAKAEKKQAKAEEKAAKKQAKADAKQQAQDAKNQQNNNVQNGAQQQPNSNVQNGNGAQNNNVQNNNVNAQKPSNNVQNNNANAQKPSNNAQNNNNNVQKPNGNNNANAQKEPAKQPATTGSSSTVSTASSVASTLYHVIVASSITVEKAKELVAQLKAKGYSSAQVLDSGSKVRVSLMSFSNSADADKAMSNARNNEGFNDAWVMSAKK
jgi:hypothetical protein